MLNTRLISQCVLRFPPISFAFAYGSAVIPQEGKPEGGKMVDFCFVIDDGSSRSWHQANLLRNPSDYSFLARSLGSRMISKIQKSDDVGAWYNTLVPVKNMDIDSECKKNVEHIKYGVVEMSDFLADLKDWRSLYLAGRCHKPVYYLDNLSCSKDIRSSLEENLKSALNVSMLQLPSKFSLADLFQTIVGLSYHGDFRMLFGEDREKITKVVKGNYHQLKELYVPLISEDSCVRIHLNSESLEQDMDPGTKLKRLLLLPSTVRKEILSRKPPNHQTSSWKSHPGNPDVEEILAAMASWGNDKILSDMIRNATLSIVLKSSLTQSTKGIISAGLFKSVRYAGDKVIKGIKSRFPAKKS